MKITRKGLWCNSMRCSAVSAGDGLVTRQMLQVATQRLTSCSRLGHQNTSATLAKVSRKPGCAPIISLSWYSKRMDLRSVKR